LAIGQDKGEPDQAQENGKGQESHEWRSLDGEHPAAAKLDRAAVQ
jgi:hypothetical protein